MKHLSCQTQYTRTGERNMKGTMHPGEVTRDTSKPAKRTKGIRAKRSKWLDIRIREWNALDSVKVQPAHRKPGSMK